MKILKVTQTYDPFLEKGGSVVKVRAIARGLARRGHRVTVLTTNLGFGDLGDAIRPLGRSRWGWRAERDGVETIYLRTLARYRALTLNPSVTSFCRASLEAFDLVHIYGLYDLLGPPVGFYCQRRGIPYVLEPMGMFRPIARNIRLKRLYHRVLGQRLIHAAACLIATSEQEKKELLEGGLAESQVVVRRNGIEVPDRLPDPGRFRRRWGIAPEAALVLFLGRLVSKKSPDMMLEAFARWRRDSPRGENSVLVLAGPEEGDGYLQKLETLATELGLEGNAMFTGPLYDDAKWAAYRDADVFVLPSQNENFGNAAGESIACGTPVIVTDRCGIAPLVEHRAGIVIPHDLQMLQDSLKTLLENQNLWQRYHAGCAEVIRGLSWEEPLSQMGELYPRLVAESAGR